LAHSTEQTSDQVWSW